MGLVPSSLSRNILWCLVKHFPPEKFKIVFPCLLGRLIIILSAVSLGIIRIQDNTVDLQGFLKCLVTWYILTIYQGTYSAVGESFVKQTLIIFHSVAFAITKVSEFELTFTENGSIHNTA